LNKTRDIQRFIAPSEQQREVSKRNKMDLDKTRDIQRFTAPSKPEGEVSSRQGTVSFISILLLVHAAFFLLACKYTRIYMGDSFEYIYEALNIKHHLFFYSGNPTLPIEPEYMTQRQPGYPLFLLSVYLFTINNWVVLIFQNLLSVLNIYYCRKVFLRLGYSARFDWLLLLLVIAYPAQFINANTIAPDILLQTFTLLYFGSFVRLFQTTLPRYALQMTAALIAGLLVKPVLYPFAFIHLIIIAAFYFRKHQRRAVAAAVLPMLAVVLYCFSNYARTGKFHFSSNQSFNAIYYYYGFVSQKQGADSARRFLQHERDQLTMYPVYHQRYDHANARGMQLLQQNFFPYMAYHLSNSARIFIEPGKAEMDLFTGRLTYGKLYSKKEDGFYATLKSKGWGGLDPYFSSNPSMPFVLLILFFNIIRLVGLFLFFFRSRIHLYLRLFILILLCYFAVAAGPIANTRYFLPVSLIAIGCAVSGFMTTAAKRKLNQ
jgi:hypothetical protein